MADPVEEVIPYTVALSESKWGSRRSSPREKMQGFHTSMYVAFVNRGQGASRNTNSKSVQYMALKYLWPTL